MAAVGPKDLDIKRIAGHWLQIAGSAALHKSFLEGCGCNQVDFKQLSENKLHMMGESFAACLPSVRRFAGILIADDWIALLIFPL